MEDLKTKVQSLDQANIKRATGTIPMLQFHSSDTETEAVLTEAARAVLGEIFNIKAIKSFHMKIVSQYIINLMAYSSFVKKYTFLGFYPIENNKYMVNSRLCIVELRLIDESCCIIAYDVGNES